MYSIEAQYAVECELALLYSLKVAVMAKVICSEFSNVQGYDEGMAGYKISAVKFHEMLITKPKVRREVLFIIVISHLKQLR
jgi:hypothetical protein